MTLESRLGAVRGLLARRRAAALLLGALALAAALFAAAALLARAGAFGVARWLPLAVWVTASGIVGVAVARAAGLWRGRGAALRETARLVEDEQRLRHGSLAGAVELAGGAPEGMSGALARAAAERAAAGLPAEPRAWAPRRAAQLGVRQGALGAAAVAGAALVAAAVWYAGDAADALASPARALHAAARPHLVIAVSSRSVRKGGAVSVRVTAPPMSLPALYVRATGEAWRPVPLAADASGRATWRVAAVTAPLYLYAWLDGTSSDTARVDVVVPPFLADFAATARFPAYLGRAEEPVVLDAGPVALPVGTAVEVRGTASTALGSAVLLGWPPADTAAGPAVPARPARDTVRLAGSGGAFRGSLAVRGSGRWVLALADPFGAPVEGPMPVLDVRAVPDSAPVVTVPVPGQDTTAPLDLKPVLVIDARDDHALSTVRILSWRISHLGVPGDTVVDSLPGADGADHIVVSRVLDLNRRGLLPGDTVRFVVRATDQAPVPHVGWSPVYALRLRSLAELREAVRRNADSLAGATGRLADDQSRLTRRTEDLAIQRSRPGATAGDSARAGDPRAPTGSMPFEQAEQARQVAQDQQRLAARADSLRQELDRVARAAEDAGLNDPAWRRQLRDLQELMRQAVTPELRQRLEELQRALERLDPQAVQQALRNLAEQQRLMREQLQRSAELFERAALEGSMQTFADNAEALRQAQELWNRSAPAQRDTAGAAAEQRKLLAQADSLHRDLAQLAQRLGQRGDSATQRTVAQAADSASRAAGAMDSAAAAMTAGERPDAARHGERASGALSGMRKRMDAQRRRMAAGWRQEVLRMMDDAVHETVALTGEEQQVARQLRQGEGADSAGGDARGRQAALEQGISQVVRRLQAASGRNAMVDPRLGASLAQARQAVGRSRESLEGATPNPDDAAEQAEGAVRALAQSAYQMMRNRNEVAGTESGSGLAEAMERMSQLAGQQGGLTDQLGSLMPMLGSGDAAIQLRLRELAARQRSLANDLERLGDSNLPGHPRQMAQEARTLADRLDQGRLDRETLERQQQLFHRMLDAGRTFQDNDQPDNPERQSETARAHGALAAPPPLAPSVLRYPPPGWSALKHLSPSDRALVLDYFRRLNAARP